MITKAKYIICAVCAICGFYSCSDLLETESTRQNIDPDISQKTDSAFYAFGILQAMQQLADQYVMLGEVRGDLVKTTQYTDNNLRQLYDFSAGTENKYDSAYVYYRVINNCNYYIAHCDTTLASGATNLVMDKYVATKAIRAWAYLQLGRNYERVPFFTEPLTQISQIDRNYPELTLAEIVAQLAPDLEAYTGYKVPSLGYAPGKGVNVGAPNWESSQKELDPRLCFIPVDLVMGDMYLETGQYAKAAQHYITYFTRSAFHKNEKISEIYKHLTAKLPSKNLGQQDDDIPESSLISTTPSFDSWNQLYARNNRVDIITYIPMATTAQNGTTTEIPKIFGFDYYATPEERQRSGAPYIDEIQLLPSAYMEELSDSTEYYYYAAHIPQIDKYDSISIAKCGDMRLRSIIHQESDATGEEVTRWIDKYKYATIFLYRSSVVWLRLAEAFNRLGMPDVAFAILKEGITENILASYGDGSYYMDYITDESRLALQTTYPLLSEANISKFSSADMGGIHTRGAGQAASDYPNGSEAGGNNYHAGLSPYQLRRMVGLKMDEIAEKYSVSVGTTKQDTINAVEDLICDEYALESAFEGNRYFDLLRIANHKNRAGIYGGNFGDLWLQKRLGDRGWTPAKKYLPFK